MGKKKKPCQKSNAKGGIIIDGNVVINGAVECDNFTVRSGGCLTLEKNFKLQLGGKR